MSSPVVAAAERAAEVWFVRSGLRTQGRLVEPVGETTRKSKSFTSLGVGLSRFVTLFGVPAGSVQQIVILTGFVPSEATTGNWIAELLVINTSLIWFFRPLVASWLMRSEERRVGKECR